MQQSYVEKLLIETLRIAKEKDPFYSVDIYYNDLDETFVVKLTNWERKLLTKHFRCTTLVDALLECYHFVSNLKKAKAFFI